MIDSFKGTLTGSTKIEFVLLINRCLYFYSLAKKYSEGDAAGRQRSGQDMFIGEISGWHFLIRQFHLHCRN